MIQVINKEEQLMLLKAFFVLHGEVLTGFKCSFKKQLPKLFNLVYLSFQIDSPLQLNKYKISQPANFIKKENLVQVLSCEFCEIYKNTFLQNTCGKLFLLFSHKTAYSSNNSHNVYKNADGNSKFI